MKRSIDTSIWGDPWFADLSATGKMVFMYLLTNDRSTAAGIFDLSPRRMAFDIGIEMADAEAALNELDGRVRWWPEHSTVWVVNFFRHQAANDNFLKSAQRTFADLPLEIRQEVVATYPEFDANPSVTHTEPIPTGSQTHTHIAKSEESRARSVQGTGGVGAANADAEAQAPATPPPDSGQKQPREKRATQIPPDWSVSDGLRKWAHDKGFTDQDIDQEEPKFLAHWLSKGEPRKDWNAGFQLWMHNARQYGHLLTKPPRHPDPGSIAEPKGYSHDPDQAAEQMRRDLENLRQQAAPRSTGHVTPIRGRTA